MQAIKYNKELIKLLDQTWKENPELRLCQLLSNSMMVSSEKLVMDIFYIEDEQLLYYLKRIREVYNNLKRNNNGK